MTTISVAALLISFLSFMTSFLSFYWNAIRAPRYRSPPLRLVKLLQFRGLPAFLGTPIVIANTATRTGVLDRLYLTLTDVTQGRTTNFWELYEGLEDPIVPDVISPDGKRSFGDQTFLNRFPKPQAVPGGTTIVKCSWFQADSPFRFDAGDYRLSMYMQSAEKQKHILLMSIPLHVDVTVEDDQYQIIADLQGKGLIAQKDTTKLVPIGTRLITPGG